MRRIIPPDIILRMGLKNYFFLFFKYSRPTYRRIRSQVTASVLNRITEARGMAPSSFLPEGGITSLTETVQAFYIAVKLLHVGIIHSLFLRVDFTTFSINCPEASRKDAEPLNTGVTKVLSTLLSNSLEASIFTA